MARLLRQAALVLSACAWLGCGSGGDPAPAPAPSSVSAPGSAASSPHGPSAATLAAVTRDFAGKLGKLAAAGWPAQVRKDESGRPVALVEVEREEDGPLRDELARALEQEKSLALVAAPPALRVHGVCGRERGMWVVEVWLIDERGAILTRSLVVE